MNTVLLIKYVSFVQFFCHKVIREMTLICGLICNCICKDGILKFDVNIHLWSLAGPNVLAFILKLHSEQSPVSLRVSQK